MNTLFHIPHASTVIPASVRSKFLICDAELDRELLCMTDWYVDEIFALPDVGYPCTFPFSRLVVDVERYLKNEPMQAKGMGAVYTKTSNGDVLRKQSGRLALIKEYYQPHHERLHRMVSNIVDQAVRCLIIDCHSFSSKPLPHEPNQDTYRPEICIGVTSTNTSRELIELVYCAFSKSEFDIKLDVPFEGSIVPEAFVGDPRVGSIMIEVNRKLYMDQSTGEKLVTSFPYVANLIREAVRRIKF